MAGRRTKCTPELIEKLCQVLSAGNYIKVACEYVGISEATYCNWVNRAEAELQRMEEQGHQEPDPREAIFIEFLKQTTRARRASEVGAIAEIKKASKEDWRAAAWFLEHSFRERWGKTKREVDVTSSDGSMAPVLLLPEEGYEKRRRDNSPEDEDE